MSTTDLQRMRQDEFLADLRSGRFRPAFGQIRGPHDTRCVLGVAYEQVSDRPCGTWNTQVAKPQIMEALGISRALTNALMVKNDLRQKFDEIADFFKEQRDAWDGDLSDWKPAS